MQKSRKNIHISLLGAAHSLNHSLFVIAPPLLALIMDNLGVTKSAIGAVATVASVLYGVGALAGGPLGDKIGEAKTIALCLTFSGLSTFIMLCAGFTRSIYVYALAMVLMASWASLYHPAANSLISKVFKGNVAESMGLHGVGGTLGVVLTPTISWLVGASLGWSWAFVTFGVLNILLALLFLKNHEKNNNKTSFGGTLLDALKIRELRTLLIFNVAIGLFMKGVELYFPTYINENRQVDQAWASVALTLVFAAGVLGQWIGGKAADRIGSKRVLVTTSIGVLAGFLLLLFVPIYLVGVGAFILLYGLSFYAHQPALNSLTGSLSPLNQRGAVYGIFFFTSFGIGSISQLIAGYVADLYGLDVAFYILTIFALTALLLSFKLPEKETG